MYAKCKNKSCWFTQVEATPRCLFPPGGQKYSNERGRREDRQHSSASGSTAQTQKKADGLGDEDEEANTNARMRITNVFVSRQAKTRY